MVRAHAVGALGQIGPAAVPTLIAVLKDNNARVRLSAVYALGKSARRRMTLFPPSSRPSKTTTLGCD